MYLEGGNISSSSGVEDTFSAEDVEELLELLPDFAKDIQYNIMQLDNEFYGECSEYALKTLFHELPDPEIINESKASKEEFKSEAIRLINRLNQKMYH